MIEQFSVPTILFNLLLVLGGILIMAWGLKEFQRKKSGFFNSTKNRLELVEMTHIGNNRHLTIVRCDNQEYLILLGPNADLVINQINQATVNSPHHQAEYL